MSYTVETEGSSTMIIEKDPAWRFKTAEFHILFDTDIHSVIKYGPNGLHFAEHILWNAINARQRLAHTNAVTYGTGEMALFGICTEADLPTTIEGVYGALIELAKGNMTHTLISKYQVEQRRVSAETSGTDEGSRPGGVEHRMFTRNSDLIRSSFQMSYFWRILLEECNLRRAILTCHCSVSMAAMTAFKAKAKELDAEWHRGRARVLAESKTPLPIPKFFAPPVSWLAREPGKIPRLVSLDPIKNPIEKMLLSIRYGNNSGAYCIKIRTTDSALRRISRDDSYDRSGLGDYDLEHQYYASPILASTSVGVDIKIEWVEDLYALTPENLIRKHWSTARAGMIRLVSEMNLSKASRR